MPRTREVYLLDPQIHSPETIAVAFAKTSRSPESFRQITAELSNEKSAQFHEKWVVGYGHSSVAEHAVLHIAVENISRLAVECLESNRLASYTEKSTRYQQWGGEDFFIPDEFSQAPENKVFLDVCQNLFKFYEKTLPMLVEAVAKEYESQPGETTVIRERKIKTTAVDVCRFILPVSAFANVGVTINARALEHAITKMLSHPLSEVRSVGREIKAVAQANIPTLLKYAKEQPSLLQIEKVFNVFIDKEDFSSETQTYSGVRLVGFDKEIENKILAAAICRFSGNTYTQASNYISSLPTKTKADMIGSIFNPLDQHDNPIRELEYGDLVFEIILDQGAYLELKRHRMMTQTPLPFSPKFGYSIPLLFEKAGLLDEYCQNMEMVKEVYFKLNSVSSAAAAYVLPNAFNRCVIIQTNFRNLYHLISLRTAPNAHFSMRRIGQQIAEQVKVALPTLGKYLKTNLDETARSIEEQFFYKV
jgi:thymidylate synthase ThyX